MGGDEFVIVMPEFKSMEDVKRCGLQFVQSTARPITIGDREIQVTVSVGVCTYPDYALEPDQLIKNADAAMYVIKGTGRNGLHISTRPFGRGRFSTTRGLVPVDGFYEWLERPRAGV